MNVEAIANALGARKAGDGFIARCPSHSDSNPSLSINQSTDGKLLVHCHAGCSQEAVLAALKKLGPSKPFVSGVMGDFKKVSEYLYRDIEGNPVLRVDRLESPKGKTFRQYHMQNGKWVPGGTKAIVRPYRFEEWKDGNSVAFVEGEKVADCLAKHGFASTTTPGGAKSWKPQFAECFKDKAVIFFPDADPVGEQYVAAALRDISIFCKSAKVVRLPGLSEGEDVFDFLKNHSIEELKQIVTQTSPEVLIKFEDNSTAVVSTVEEAPRPLFRDLAEPEEFPLDDLGPILGNAAKQMKEVIQAPGALCGQSVLAAAALAVQGHVDVEIDGRRYPTSLYCLTIGKSGERKSQVDKQSLLSHREHEKNLVTQYNTDLKEHAEELLIDKELRSKAASGKKDKASLRLALRELGEIPEPPLKPFFICQDPTIEGLEKGFQFGQPSQGVFSDEGGKLFGGFGLKAENAMKTISGFCDLWDGGKPITRNRSGEGSSIQYQKRLSVHLLATPVVAQEVLSSQLMSQQGFLARCLICWPKSKMGERPYLEKDLTQSDELSAYVTRMREILLTPPPIADGTRNELNPRALQLSPIAKQLFIKFHDFVESNLGPEGLFFNIQPFAGKAPEHCARIAGVLAVFENLACKEIDEVVLGRAIELTKYYLSEAVRIGQASCLSPELVLAEKTLSWINRNGYEHVYLSKIYQFGPSGIHDAATARKIAEVLTNHGWFKQIEEGMKIDGAFRREAWRVIK